MSLFSCPDCNNEISFSAKSCTDCGCGIKSYHIKNHLNTLYYSEKKIMAKDYAYREKQKVTCDHCQESYQKYIKTNSSTEVNQEVIVDTRDTKFFENICGVWFKGFYEVNLTRVCEELNKAYLLPSNKVKFFEATVIGDWGSNVVGKWYCEECKVILHEETLRKEKNDGERIKMIFYAIIIIVLLIFFFG